jgi:RNA polymerase subunit RPABC4/transcription elongation factor Spt4
MDHRVLSEACQCGVSSAALRNEWVGLLIFMMRESRVAINVDVRKTLKVAESLVYVSSA